MGLLVLVWVWVCAVSIRLGSALCSNDGTRSPQPTIVRVSYAQGARRHTTHDAHKVLDTRRIHAPTRNRRAVLDVDRRRTWRQSSRADEQTKEDQRPTVHTLPAESAMVKVWPRPSRGVRQLFYRLSQWPVRHGTGTS